jgi:hypothetical protein
MRTIANPEEKVAPKPPEAGELLQRSRRPSDDPYVVLVRPLGKRTRHARLKSRGQEIDRVDIQRHTRRVRREGSVLFVEQLRFDLGLHEPLERNRNEGVGRPRPELVNALREDALPGSRLAVQDQVDVGMRQVPERALDLSHGRARPGEPHVRAGRVAVHETSHR